ncbi:hypothetical protein EDC04DRAFT_2607038 [Pisolithus marmoratus]|nr:hypothetical protein EDC04DRAFT_2607038 [Pisolithus marmoratus]
MFKNTVTEMTMSGKGPVIEPPEATVRALERMADDPKNKIWVLSESPVKGALERPAERVSRAGITAENRCFAKTRVANLDLAWKVPCVEILNYFIEWTPGSFVEERATPVMWRFWTVPLP